MLLETDIYDIPEASLDENRLQGKGAKGLLLIARESDLADGGKEKLEAIIKAIKMDIEQDAYLYVYPDEKDTKVLGPFLRKNKISDLLLFGINPKDLSLTIQAKLYTTFHFENLSLIISHKIHEMNANRSYKLALWNCLQEHFLKSK